MRIMEHWIKEQLVWLSSGKLSKYNSMVMFVLETWSACEHSPHMAGFEAVGTAVPIFIWFCTSGLIFSYFMCKN